MVPDCPPPSPLAAPTTTSSHLRPSEWLEVRHTSSLLPLLFSIHLTVRISPRKILTGRDWLARRVCVNQGAKGMRAEKAQQGERKGLASSPPRPAPPGAHVHREPLPRPPLASRPTAARATSSKRQTARITDSSRAVRELHDGGRRGSAGGAQQPTPRYITASSAWTRSDAAPPRPTKEAAEGRPRRAAAHNVSPRCT